MQEHKPRTLGDLGERTILKQIVIPLFSAAQVGPYGIGDDCALIPITTRDHFLAITTDPCPTPVVFELGDQDYWHFGWMTALINVSDLAAAGATPIGIVVSTIMPPDMPVADYQRFLDGLEAAASRWACPVLGGNIKDGPTFSATGTALGLVKADAIMRRVGATAGDWICVVGTMGLFWAAVLQRMFPEQVTVGLNHAALLRQALHRPEARLSEGLALAASGLVSTCMDASDGVGGCLIELAEQNGADFVLDGSLLRPHQTVAAVAHRLGIDGRKLMLSWGNWELVLTVPAEKLRGLNDLAAAQGFTCTPIGRVRPGPGYVLLDEDGAVLPVVNFASERFTGTSYFTHGLEAYADWLLGQPLTTLK
jgi:thiamine-monophosphate kinase